MNEHQVEHGKAAILNRGIDVLIAVKNTKIATSAEIHIQVLPNLSKRAAQRYLKSLVVIGLVYTVGNNNSEYRYFLSDKAKQLFGDAV